VVGVQLEPREDLSSDYLVASLCDQPVVEEDRRAGVADAPETDFRLPETALELLPVLLVRRLDVHA